MIYICTKLQNYWTILLCVCDWLGDRSSISGRGSYFSLRHRVQTDSGTEVCSWPITCI